MPLPRGKPGTNSAQVLRRRRGVLAPAPVPPPVAEDASGDDVLLTVRPAIAARFQMLGRGFEQARLCVGKTVNSGKGRRAIAPHWLPTIIASAALAIETSVTQLLDFGHCNTRFDIGPMRYAPAESRPRRMSLCSRTKRLVPLHSPQVESSLLLHRTQTDARERHWQQILTCVAVRSGTCPPTTRLRRGPRLLATRSVQRVGSVRHVREFRGYRRAKPAVKDARFPQFAAQIGSPTPRFAAPFGRP